MRARRSEEHADLELAVAGAAAGACLHAGACICRAGLGKESGGLHVL